MSEYDEAPQQISSHTTPAQQMVGMKRGRDDDGDGNGNGDTRPSMPIPSGLPAKPEDVRSTHCTTPSPLSIYLLTHHLIRSPSLSLHVTSVSISLVTVRYLPASCRSQMFLSLLFTFVSLETRRCRMRYVQAMEWSMPIISLETRRTPPGLMPCTWET